MKQADPDWSTAGQGEQPSVAWSFSLDAPMSGLSVARETGEVLAVDSSGGLYLLDRRGRIKTLTRGFKSLHALAWSDTGANGAAATNALRLCWFDHTLSVKWSMRPHAEILALAVDSHGHYVAISLANSETIIFNSRKKEVGRYETDRPLKYLQFVTAKPLIVGAAEYGLLCCHRLDGTEVWEEKMWSNVGDVSITGDGEEIYLARFNQGVQKLDRNGRNRSSYILSGTPNHVSTSYAPRRLGVTTVERDIYWMDEEGELIWATHLPDDVCGIRADALGRGMTLGLKSSGRIYRLEWAASRSK